MTEKKDWTGNSKAVYSTLGASNHSNENRATHDYYATDPTAMTLLLEKETFNNNVWECAAGEKHLAKVLERAGYTVKCSDIINRTGDIEVIDFLTYKGKWSGDIITNPPYKYAADFVAKALDIIPKGRKVAMFLKLQFLEGKARRKLFDKYPPKTVYVASGRLVCAKNGDFEHTDSSAVAYCWFVWEKGFKGDPVIKWIN